MAKTTGGAILAGMLKQEGVEAIFGIIDGTYTQLYVHCVEQGMALYSPRHESTAAHMAGAYARLTGRLGVCIASNGPGVANVLSGVAVENTEGNRVLLITSCRRSPIVYPDRGGSYQCFDQVAVIRGMSKWSHTVPSAGRLPELMRKALRACYRGRPGVVHLDVPEDIINGHCEPVDFWAPEHYRRHHPIEPPAEKVDRAAAMLAEAELPLVHAGSGVIHALAFEELRLIAERLHAPVTTSWAARGVFPENHLLSWPMVLLKANNQIRNVADVVLCLGARLGETDWWGKPPYWAPADRQRLIQVDIDEEALGRNRASDAPICGDVRVFLRRLLECLDERLPESRVSRRKAALQKLVADREKERQKLDRYLEDRGRPMVTAHVAHVCRHVFADDAVTVLDGGNAAVWGNFFHEVRVPNTLLSTYHMGHLGAGLGQALGAAVARPGRQVYCILGDGAMGFHLQEIETAVRHKLPVVFLVICDKQWGMVKINQSFALKPMKTMLKKALAGGENINTDFHEIRFDKLAEAMDGHGERVSDPEELKPALERALASGTCAVIHIDVDPVKHMWAPGLLQFKEMHQEPKGK